MAYLEEIPKYKDALLRSLIANEKIIEYIGRTDIEDPTDLIGVGGNIYPYPYVPSTQEEARTYICFDIYVPSVQDMMFKDIQIAISVFSHKDVGSYQGKSRVDLIAIELDKLLNGNQDYGIDAAQLKQVSPYLPNDSYFGKTLFYRAYNLNQNRGRGNEHPL